MITCEVQTLLNETKAKVCASIVDGKSFLAKRSGRPIADRKSWGRKASDSRGIGEAVVVTDDRYRSVL